ncbi:hypothetical protein L596_008203 [Steinernema carpocapsae]|uniref:RGS domain-containing protein n=1 Tax=Steinernema carpocapsae TaxID=34508 RepID=A0A4U5PCA6_STECR|nr:hypothetical protein L596_008203 [Steinernema carpocapsae]
MMIQALLFLCKQRRFAASSRTSRRSAQRRSGFGRPAHSRPFSAASATSSPLLYHDYPLGPGGLTVHNGDRINSSQQLDYLDDRTTYEEVSAWSMNFDRLMKNKSGQKYFAEFLKSEYSDENILFWQACEELKRERNAEKIEEKARIIYEDFISILSPKEVSLDSRVREIINNNMVHPSAHTFDEAQNQIYTLMQRDSYPRFVASSLYKKIVGSYGHVEDL